MSNPTLTEAAPDVTAAEPVLADETVPAEEQELVTADLLVEEVSIDGMCGVY
jgi:mycofactocin precursor